jgi:hypothetical protein
MGVYQEIKKAVSNSTSDEKEYRLREKYLNYDRNDRFIGESYNMPKAEAESSEKVVAIERVDIDGNETEYITTFDKIKSVSTPIEEFNHENR